MARAIVIWIVLTILGAILLGVLLTIWHRVRGRCGRLCRGLGRHADTVADRLRGTPNHPTGAQGGRVCLAANGKSRTARRDRGGAGRTRREAGPYRQ